jgi:hypothetical protein
MGGRTAAEWRPPGHLSKKTHVMQPPINVWSWHLYTPLCGQYSRTHTYIYFYLLCIYIFVRVFHSSHARMDRWMGDPLDGHKVVYGVCHKKQPRPQPKCEWNSIRLSSRIPNCGGRRPRTPVSGTRNLKFSTNFSSDGCPSVSKNHLFKC